MENKCCCETLFECPKCPQHGGNIHDHSKYCDEHGKFRHDARELDYAYVRDIETDGLRSIFIRLVKPGEVTNPGEKIDSYSWDGDVTLDEVDGKIVGITVTQFKNLE